MPAPHDDPLRTDPDFDGDADDDLFDELEAPKRTNRLTAALVVALLVVGGFAGGVLAQKHHDTGLAAAAAGVPRRQGGTGGPGAGLPGGGRPTTAPTAGATAGAAADSNPADQPPAVVGRISKVEGGDIEVTDPTGAVVRVVVPRTATVTAFGLGGLTVDTPVAVTGTRAADGSVTATSVTARQPGG